METPGDIGGRRCPRPGCTKTLLFGIYACGPHWFELPLPLRSRIVTTWARLRPFWPERMGEALAHRYMTEYSDATEAAEQWWLANKVTAQGTLLGS